MRLAKLRPDGAALPAASRLPAARSERRLDARPARCRGHSDADGSGA